MIRRALVACAVLVGAAAVSHDAAAFCRSTTCKCKSKDSCPQDCGVGDDGCKTKGAPLAWHGSCPGIALNKDYSANLDRNEAKAALIRAFAAWTDVDCGDGKKASISIASVAETSCHRVDYSADGPNVNVLYFEDNNFVPSDTSDVLAKTIPHFDSETGEIFDADIVVDTSQNSFSASAGATSKNDLQTVLTHEVGHFLGLDHTSDESAIMYFQYSAGSLNRELQPDDIAAICAAYPPARGATCDPTPKGGQADSCDPTTGGCTQAGAPAEGGVLALGAGVLVAGVNAARRSRKTRRPTRR